MQRKKAYHKVSPYGKTDTSKKTEVAEMFDRISANYDFLNHFLSLGIDKRWRLAVIKSLRPLEPQRVLDVATGTGDLAIQVHKSLRAKEIIGVDISPKMLEIGQKKIERRGIKNIRLEPGDSEDLRFESDYFDATTVAFGVRNFETPIKGLREMYRVLRPGGRIAVLEFSKPRSKIFGSIYSFYFKYVLPKLGRLLSKDKRAYSYLQESVSVFPDYNRFTDMMEDAGFNQCTYRSLTFGICCLYTGEK